MITLRPIDPDCDFPGIVQLVNAIDARGITVEEYATNYRNTSAWLAYRAVAVDTDQDVRGYAVAVQVPGMPAGQFSLWIGVDPEHGRRGIGSSLFTAIESFLKTQDITCLQSDVSDACPGCLAFAQQRGFRVERHLFESTLDLAHFDPGRFAGALEAVTTQGIRFATFADLAPTTENQRRLYELDQRISQDIPGGDWFPLRRTTRRVLAR